MTWLHGTPRNVLVLMTESPFHVTCSACRIRVTLLLLILAGVESNAGSERSIRLRVLNAGGAAQKAAGMSAIVADNHLDALAVCKTWMLEITPDALKLGLAPPGIAISHCSTNRFAVVDCLSSLLTTSWFTHIRCKISSTANVLRDATAQRSTWLQCCLVANIYRRPSASKMAFIDEFGVLLTALCFQASDFRRNRQWICRLPWRNSDCRNISRI